MKNLLKWQQELDEVIMKDLDISDDARLGNCVTALMVESCELANELRYFKHWSKKGADLDKAKEELMDCFHFALSIANQLGMSADDVYEAYEAKRQINFERQKTGY